MLLDGSYNWLLICVGRYYITAGLFPLYFEIDVMTQPFTRKEWIELHNENTACDYLSHTYFIISPSPNKDTYLKYVVRSVRQKLKDLLK